MRRRTAARLMAFMCGLVVLGTLLWYWHPRWFRYQHWIADGHNRLVPPEWYVQDLQSSDPKLRARAARVLASKGYRYDVSSHLAPMLADANATVRSWAVEGLYLTRRFQGSLQAMSDRQLVQRLRQVLYHDPSSRVRNRASGALLLLLREAFVSDPELSASVRQMIADAASKDVVRQAPTP